MKRKLFPRKFRTLSFAISVLLMLSCTELRRPDPNPYLSETQPPPVQEFRWSNGGMPQSLDPALASGAPETDVVRAIYEGLTRIDSKTLDAIPGVAEKWQVSDDGLEWTFTLRNDAKWSNGRPVTAGDFVRTWQRLFAIGGAGAHRNLLNNFHIAVGSPEQSVKPAEDFEGSAEQQLGEGNTNTEVVTPSPTPETTRKKDRLAISAPDEQTITIKLRHPDPDFPKLVAHPIFAPVFSNDSNFSNLKSGPKIVTNGAFHITAVDDDGIALERSEAYWNVANVQIEKLRFVSIARSEDALDAYRTGRIDALTNTEISPLAQKVFSTAADFRKNTFAALNFYELNYRKAPFNDRRVREALSIALEREALVNTIGETTAQPALAFLPFGPKQQKKIVQDKDRAQELLEQAGFPNGQGFAPFKLTVNRNETQLRVARAVAKMWKDNLNIDATLDIREANELPDLREKGEYDVIRRGAVFPVPDEMASIAAIDDATGTGVLPETEENRLEPANETSSNSANVITPAARPTATPESHTIQTEAEVIYQSRVIPLYFPMSFSLVKPYVNGFQLNSLDAPDLTELSIDTAWQPQVR